MSGPTQRRSAYSSRQEEETEFLGALIRASAWPEKQYVRLFKRLPMPGRVVMLLATAAALYWLVESGAWIPLLVLGVAAFVVTVIVHETVMERKYPTPRSLRTRGDDHGKPRRKPEKDEWWDEMMAQRQREEEPRVF
ncbi:hypothetical protein [Kitasatospora sp. DSM 101779]|uniref:hypothetical protein n=1 Tax=Kitasatospora sp. DSM 101779 TaxID=2853165 RepID=UPI0021D9790E|nr:hypothetical protein [Kitasatospora sp. DSM 101779]MCU7826957.1 hypothetical protein [Kitasatospora sp. DSM 101779]